MPARICHNQDSGGVCCAASRDEVAQRAFAIYRAHGSVDGHDLQNWLDAEADLANQHAPTSLLERMNSPGLGLG
jgi:hypothetical protein